MFRLDLMRLAVMRLRLKPHPLCRAGFPEWPGGVRDCRVVEIA